MSERTCRDCKFCGSWEEIKEDGEVAFTRVWCDALPNEVRRDTHNLCVIGATYDAVDFYSMDILQSILRALGIHVTTEEETH